MKRIWESPTITTWLSYSTKALTLFAVLPLILKQFSAGDVALWYLFFSIMGSLTAISEFGFKQTFSRLISYAYVGAEDIGKIDIKAPGKAATGEPNVPLLHTVVYGMKKIYFITTLIFTLIIATFGSWSILKPIKAGSNVHEAWISWAIIATVSSISFYGKVYSNYLEGLYKVALVKRIEALMSIGAIISSFLVLYISPSLLNLVIVNQIWVLFIVFRDMYLCYKIDGGLYRRVSKKIKIDKSIYSKIWEPAWKTGIGLTVSTGIMNLNSVFVAQVSDAAFLASYLLALRIINLIKEISMAPFYSKIPLISMLRAKNDIDGIIKVSKRGMFISHLAYALGFVCVGMFSSFFLHMIHSETQFVDHTMWILLGIGFFFQRMGGMHLQVYLTSNHIISYVADLISGVLFVISLYILFPLINLYAVPTAIIIGYTGFYFWYAASYSYKSMNLNFGNFEFSILRFPFLLFVIYLIDAYYLKILKFI